MSLTQEQAQKRVKALVAYHTGFPAEKLEARSDLFVDVRVDGADAEDLLPFNPFALLQPSWWQWQRERTPVTINVLTQAAMTGVWPFDYGDKVPSS